MLGGRLLAVGAALVLSSRPAAPGDASGVTVPARFEQPPAQDLVLAIVGRQKLWKPTEQVRLSFCRDETQQPSPTFSSLRCF